MASLVTLRTCPVIATRSYGSRASRREQLSGSRPSTRTVAAQRPSATPLSTAASPSPQVIVLAAPVSAKLTASSFTGRGNTLGEAGRADAGRVHGCYNLSCLHGGRVEARRSSEGRPVARQGTRELLRGSEAPLTPFQLQLRGAEGYVHLSDPAQALFDAGVTDGAYLLVVGVEPAAAVPPFLRRFQAASPFLPLLLGMGALVFFHSNLSATLAGLFKDADAVLALSVAGYGWVRPSSAVRLSSAHTISISSFPSISIRSARSTRR